MAKHPAKTDNHERVYAHLRKAAAPLTAYQILEGMHDASIRSPVTIYRALDRLIGEGRVHRLDSLNAFVPCSQLHDPHDAPIFAICSDCGVVREIVEPGLLDQLRKFAAAEGFSVTEARVEMRGRCAHCADRANAG